MRFWSRGVVNPCTSIQGLQIAIETTPLPPFDKLRMHTHHTRHKYASKTSNGESKRRNKRYLMFDYTQDFLMRSLETVRDPGGDGRNGNTNSYRNKCQQTNNQSINQERNAARSLACSLFLPIPSIQANERTIEKEWKHVFGPFALTHPDISPSSLLSPRHPTHFSQGLENRKV